MKIFKYIVGLLLLLFISSCEYSNKNDHNIVKEINFPLEKQDFIINSELGEE